MDEDKGWLQRDTQDNILDGITVLYGTVLVVIWLFMKIKNLSSRWRRNPEWNTSYEMNLTVLQIYYMASLKGMKKKRADLSNVQKQRFCYIHYYMSLRHAA